MSAHCCPRRGETHFHAAHRLSASRRIIAAAFYLIISACLWGGAQAAELSAPVVTPGDLTNGPAASIQFEPQIARGANGYLAVWTDYRTALSNITYVGNYGGFGQGSLSDIYAARLDAAGHVIDTTPIVVAQQSGYQNHAQVAWDGQNWLVAWLAQREDDYYSYEIRAARVSADGALLDQTPLVIRASTTNQSVWPRALIHDGVNWIIVWHDYPVGVSAISVYAARVTSAGVVLDPNGKEIYRHTSYFLDEPDIAFAGDGFLLTFTDTTSSTNAAVRGVRLSPNLDQIGASFRINVNTPLSNSKPKVATDGTNYFVIWGSYSANTSATRLLGSRVSRTGQVLDPNGIVIVTNIGTQGTFPDICWDGTNYFISYEADFNERTQTYTGDKDMYVKRVSPTGAVLDAVGLEVKTGPNHQHASAIAPGAQGGAEVVWEDGLQDLDVMGAFVSAGGAVGPEMTVPLGAPAQSQPRIASGGDGFLLVYRSNTATDMRILAQHLDATGNPIGEPIFVFGGTQSIDITSVAWNGSVFLVVWADGTSGTKQIYAKRISPAGAVLDAQPIPVMQGSVPDVAALGDNFLVVGVLQIGISSPIRNIRSIRVNGAGQVLGEPAIVDYNFNDAPRVTALGNRWLVVWQGKSRHDAPSYSAQGAFVAADGTPTPEFPIGSGDTPHVAAAGDIALVVRSVVNRSDTRNLHRDIQATRIQADGTILDGFVVTGAPGDQLAPAVAWDGAQFVVAWWDEREETALVYPRGDIYGARVARTGVVLEEFAVANATLPEETPFVAANANGQTVFAYAKFYDNAPYSAYRITLRPARLAPPPAGTPPAPPTNLIASRPNGTTATLSWTDNSADEVGFKLEVRSPTLIPNWSEFARTGPNVTSYSNYFVSESEPYYFRVRAFNAAGDSAYTNEVSPPRVKITGPFGGTYTAPAEVAITADAADADGQITSVEFYANGTLVGTDTAAPYSFTWTNIPPGEYNLRARTTDNQGFVAWSPNDGAGFAVLAPPTATITSPSNGAVFSPQSSINISATAVTHNNRDDEYVNRMDFYANGTLIGTINGYYPTYSYTWSNVAPGIYTLTAVPRNNWFTNGTSNSVQITVGSSVPAGSVIISEFRLSGPGSATDEYVELYNTTDASITVTTADGSGGWALASAGDPAPSFVIPNGTVLPARGHYLAVNGGYSLGTGAGGVAGDLTYLVDFEDNTGIALFRTSDSAGFTAANCLDAVGFNSATGATADLYREGNGLVPLNLAINSEEQYAFVRKQAGGAPQDTGDNAADFVLVSTTGTIGGTLVQLGAPGPENTSSPIQRNAQLKTGLIDPQQPSTAAPNRVRDTAAVPNGTLGTLVIRRRFTNKTGAPITALRFRIVDITTLNTPNASGAAQADLRALDSVDVFVQTTSGAQVLVRGTTLDQPSQANGGGLNTALVAPLPGGSLANGATVSVQFVLGVQQGGSFRFLVNTEALTATSPPATSPVTKAGARSKLPY